MNKSCVILNQSFRAVAAFLVLGAGFPMEAKALCPNASNNCNAICTMNSTTWECDITKRGDTQGGEGYIVYGLNAGFYNGWGTDTSGTPFCCEISDTSIRTLSLRGGSHADDLNFQFSTYTLDSHTAFTNVNGLMSGGGGGDSMMGSCAANSYYTEALHGDGGADVIDGDDGNDSLFGGTDDDILTGGVGDDILSGGDGNDAMSGENGDDILHGDDGADSICGDSQTGSDTLHGDGGNDALWSAEVGDANFGGVGADACDANATLVSCESTLTSRPAACP